MQRTMSIDKISWDTFSPRKGGNLQSEVISRIMSGIETVERDILTIKEQVADIKDRLRRIAE